MDIKELTIQEEKDILSSLNSKEYVGNGSSRLVFRISADIAKYLNLPSEDYVIKLACGGGGYTQNHAEIDAYKKYGDELPLARIVAYGKFIEVMEYVEPHPYIGLLMECYDWLSGPTDLSNIIHGDYGDDEDVISEEEVDFIYNTIMVVADYFGYTSDNCQIGYAATDGRLVLYDYGYSTDCTSCQVSDHTYNVPLAGYCDFLINNYLEIGFDELDEQDQSNYRELQDLNEEEEVVWDAI